MSKPIIILSLGGSIIVPAAIDIVYLKKFVNMLNVLTRQYQFVIFTGGGSTARSYQNAAKRSCTGMSSDNLDWIGIQASILNAELVKRMFKEKCHDFTITDPRVKLKWDRPIHLGAGWKPGRSTDYDAVRLAMENSISKVINLSNIDYVYTKDPKKFKTAQKITDISWKDFRKIIGSTWDPGLNVPFDPIAAKLAQQKNISVQILNGKNLNNLKLSIQNQPCQGTLIH